MIKPETGHWSLAGHWSLLKASLTVLLVLLMNLQYWSRTVLFICLLLVPWAIRMGIVQCVSTSVRPLISKKVIRRTVPYRTYVCLITFDPDASLGNNSKYGPSMY